MFPPFFAIKNFRIPLPLNKSINTIVPTDKRYSFYIANEDKFLNLYNGKYLVIADDMSVHPFEDKIDAYYYGEEN